MEMILSDAFQFASCSTRTSMKINQAALHTVTNLWSDSHVLYNDLTATPSILTDRLLTSGWLDIWSKSRHAN